MLVEIHVGKRNIASIYVKSRIDAKKDSIGFIYTTHEIDPKTLTNALEYHGLTNIQNEQDLEDSDLYLLTLPKPADIIDEEHTINVYYK